MGIIRLNHALKYTCLFDLCKDWFNFQIVHILTDMYYRRYEFFVWIQGNHQTQQYLPYKRHR
jgi:hypothetical protein